MPGRHAADHDTEQQQRGGVVEQALALHEREQPGRQLQPARERAHRDRVGAGKNRAEDQPHLDA